MSDEPEDVDADRLRRARAASRAARRPHRPRLRGAHAHPARGHPAAARGPRPARPGRHRHRQDRRLRPPRAPALWPTATGTSPAGPGPGADPRAGHAGVRGDPPLRARPRRPGAARLRRPAHRPPAPGAVPGRRRRRRHPGPGRRPHPPGQPAARRRASRSCSTRPTRCSTWASPRTSRRILGAVTGPNARPCCSRPPCRPASAASPGATSTIRSASRSAGPSRLRAAAPLVRQTRLHGGPGPQAGRARSHPRRRGPDRRPRVLPHPQRGRRAHRDPQRAAATGPRRCTAAWTRASATG